MGYIDFCTSTYLYQWRTEMFVVRGGFGWQLRTEKMDWGRQLIGINNIRLKLGYVYKKYFDILLPCFYFFVFCTLNPFIGTPVPIRFYNVRYFNKSIKKSVSRTPKPSLMLK